MNVGNLLRQCEMATRKTLERRAEIIREISGYQVDSETINLLISGELTTFNTVSISTSNEVRRTTALSLKITGSEDSDLSLFSILADDTSGARLASQSEVALLSVHSARLKSFGIGRVSLLGYSYSGEGLIDQANRWLSKFISMPNDKVIQLDGRAVPNRGETAHRQITRFFSAFGESNIKYRYIELYRIIENMYILDTFDEIKTNFLKSPRQTLDKAGRRIRSELEQIISISEKPGMSPLFSQVYNDIKGKNGDFARRIRAKRGENLKGRGAGALPDHLNGAATVYAVRCAIVHAGEQDIVYDQFDDADDFVDSLIDSLATLCVELVFAG
jgi:hypothetical protein